jgi:hypothetical protein
VRWNIMFILRVCKIVYKFYTFIIYCYDKLIIWFHFTDEVEIHNNPNLHSEEQNELEIPDGKKFLK